MAGTLALLPQIGHAFSCPHLDSDVARAMQGWQVPGLALGAVRNDQVVAIGTYGVRDLDTEAPVMATTLFGVGSLTKSVTALGIATHALEGGPALDAPVVRLLPYFPPGITLRHLLSHSAGWPRHDALWYLDAYGMDGLARRLAQLPRFAAAGEAFQYNNITYAAAGRAQQTVTRLPWSIWIAARILDRAGMEGTKATISAFRAAANRATGHYPSDRGRLTIPLRETDPVAPAAGLYTHLNDMLRYLQVLSNEGRVGDLQAVPTEAVRALITPQADAGNRKYGLGLNLSEWRGLRMAYHPGFIDGFGAHIAILPARRAGVVVLTNMSGETPTARIVSQTLLDCLMDVPRTDWIARFGGGRARPKPKPPAPAPVPLNRAAASYGGNFTHPAYGTLTFSPNADGTKLVGRFHWRLFYLDYAGNDRWRLGETKWPLRDGLHFTFGGHRSDGFASVAAPLADGPTYRHAAGPLIFSRTLLPSPVPEPF